jgi:ribulose-5-phosphate 4-epimerase/fuculose-1-phosphate aldolase
MGDPTGHAVVHQLVEAVRMLARAAIIDYSGHCSVRRDGGSFFINSGASVRPALSANDVVLVDLDGALLNGSAPPPIEFHIHSEVYRARADVNAVMHTHPRWSTLLTSAGVQYQPVFGQGALLGEVAVLDSPLSINTAVKGRTLAATLRDRSAILLKAHGAVVVGTDIVECFALAAYLEENAQRQYRALQIGAPYVLSAAEQQACRDHLRSPSLFRKTWDHYRSNLSTEGTNRDLDTAPRRPL